MTEHSLPERSDSREGLVDLPDGTDFVCDECGRVFPDTPEEDFDHDCGGVIKRVERAYFWDGNRTDVVIAYANVLEPLEEDC